MTAVIAAMDKEIELVKARLQNAEEHNVCGIACTTGKLEGSDVVVIKSGIGKTSAAAATAVALSVFGVDAVINTGLCAGKCEKGTVIVASKCVQYDFDMTADSEPLGKNPDFPSAYYPADAELNERLIKAMKELGLNFETAVVASGDNFMADENRMNGICDTFNAVGVEMESGAVAQVCTKSGVPFAVLRCVSDGGNSVEDYYTFAERACRNFSEVLFAFFRKAQGR